MYCRNCKKEYPEGSRFCGSCGAPLVRMLDIYGERFYEGDMEAFNYIYADTYSWVLNEVRKIFAVNVSEIDDCVQEIYLLLYRKIRQYNPERGSFSAWFNTLVRNRIYDYGRKLARNKEFVPDEEEGYFSEMVDENIHINPEAKLERSERERILDEIMQELSESQRLCIQLFYCEGLKIKEIAERLNISEGTVKSRLHNGLKKLNVKVTDMQKRGLYTFTMAPLAFFLWIISRDDCSAKGDYFALQKAQNFMAQNALQQAKNMAAANGAGQAKGAVNPASKVPGAMAGKASGTAVKATVLKILAGGITAAVIGTAGFFGGRMIKNHQAKKETTQTQNGQNNQDKSNKQNGQNSSGASDNQGSAGKNTKGSSKQFVNNNEAFVKEMLTLAVNSNTLVQDNKEKSLRDAVDVSMMLMYDSNSSNEGDSEIWNVVSKDQVKDTKADNQGGSISVQESAFDKMKQFLGCETGLEKLSTQYGEKDQIFDNFSCKNGVVAANDLYPNADDMKSVNILLKRPLDNGDMELFFVDNVYETPEQVYSAVISPADNALGAQLSKVEVKLKADNFNKILGAAAVLGKQYTANGNKLSGNISEISDANKMTALIDSVYWYHIMNSNDMEEDMGVSYPVFSEDDVEATTANSVTVKKSAFNDYLNFVSYNGTIDDVKNYAGEDQTYGCAVNIEGDRITFTFEEDGDIPYSLQGTEEKIKQSLKMDKQGNLTLDFQLFEMEGAGDQCTMVMGFDGNSGLKLKSFVRK